MMRLSCCAVAVLFALSSGTAVSQSLPRVPGARIVTVSPNPGGWSEPSIAVNPRNPGQVVVVFQGPVTMAYSTDSARTFSIAEIAPMTFRSAGDVVTTFDNKGNAFFTHISQDSLGAAYYWARNVTRNGIFVQRSLDGGKTWERPETPVIAWLRNEDPITGFEDMARIFADNGPHSSHAGNLYVGTIEWRLSNSVILFSRSTDTGKTWSKPIVISTRPGLPRDNNGAVVGFTGTVGADGTVYTVWHEGNWITLAISHNGGRTFAPSRRIIETASPYMDAVPGVSRVMGFPQIGVTWPKRAGDKPTLIVTWSDYRYGDIDVFVSRSVDGGRAWSPSRRVNDDPIHDGSDQFYNWLAVDPVTNDVYVNFYDRRTDPRNRKALVTLARSTDAGRTFRNYAWTDEPFEGNNVFLGDYTWLTAYDHRVYGVWAEAVRRSDPAQAAALVRPAPPRRDSTIVNVGVADFTGVK
jgi:hypothetical protein